MKASWGIVCCLAIIFIQTTSAAYYVGSGEVDTTSVDATTTTIVDFPVEEVATTTASPVSSTTSTAATVETTTVATPTTTSTTTEAPTTGTTSTTTEKVVVPVVREEEVKKPIIRGPPVECTTARGKKGTCSVVSDCYGLLVPQNGTVEVRNRVLVEMLVEAAGFCDEEGKTRSEITPLVMQQVWDSEVLLCCPEMNSLPADTFKVDDAKTAAEVFEENFKAKSCGVAPAISSGAQNRTNEDSEFTDSFIYSQIEEGKIVKGRKTKVGEFPWVVALMNKNRQFCGGSLINKHTVLTAAHCVQHMTSADVRNLKLQIGDWNIHKTDDVKHEVRGVKAVKYHKGFSMNHLNHDIALLVLDRPVAFTDTLQPICLHSGEPNPEDGKTTAIVAGWGALAESGGQPSDMRAVEVRVLKHGECQRKYSSTKNKIGDGMVCAGADKGEDSCQGDSGGPLFVDWKSQAKQMGVVSWGVGCGRYPGVYTAVYKYLSWINTNMGKD